MSCARGTTLTFFIMYPPDVRGLPFVNLFEKLVHNAVRHFFMLASSA